MHDPLSLGHDHVLAIHPDGAGHLWMGTLDGLSRFAARTQQFAHFKQADFLSGQIINIERHRLGGDFGVQRGLFMP